MNSLMTRSFSHLLIEIKIEIYAIQIVAKLLYHVPRQLATLRGFNVAIDY
ncbi:MAG: hypothetical protein GY854_11865 [Deltaproteobacteria bacterium]|nr:hypothetical protein [Deltaproteobacteria bacterium]